MVIIPPHDANEGDVIEFGGVKYTVDKHFSQGKDMKDKGYTHIMFSNKGAFGIVPQPKQEVVS